MDPSPHEMTLCPAGHQPSISWSQGDIIIIILLYYIITIELTHSKTILEITVEIEPQPAALDFKNLSQYSSRSK